jgi:hypothetical protein
MYARARSAEESDTSWTVYEAAGCPRIQLALRADPPLAGAAAGVLAVDAGGAGWRAVGVVARVADAGAGCVPAGAWAGVAAAPSRAAADSAGD